MLETKVKKLIDEKAKDLNSQENIAECVSCIIRRLNEFIDEDITLKDDEIKSYLDQLIGYFTTTLYLPLLPELKIMRARVFEEAYRASDVNELSYIPEAKKACVTLGRLNLAEEPIYYGCIYFNESWGGVNVALSEVNAKPMQTVNILRSEVTEDKELNVCFIGIYDLIFREAKPYFMTEDVFSYFKDVYGYQQEKYTENVFLAHQLCDAFFLDILRRREHGNLYRVTSRLAGMFLEGDEVDGVVYTSVKAEGSPVIALKTTAVDSKLCHKKAESFLVKKDYGYALYNALLTAGGEINSSESTIVWKKQTTNKL